MLLLAHAVSLLLLWSTLTLLGVSSLNTELNGYQDASGDRRLQTFQAEVTTLSLVDSDTDQVIVGFEDLGANGLQTLALASLPPNLNILATTVGPDTVLSVQFVLVGILTKTENGAPWAFFGDFSGDFKPWNPSPGLYTLIVTPYSQKSGGGLPGVSKTLQMNIVAGSQQPPTAAPVAITQSPTAPPTAAPVANTQSPTAAPVLTSTDVPTSPPTLDPSSVPTSAPFPAEQVCTYVGRRYVNCGNQINDLTLNGQLWEKDNSVIGGAVQVVPNFISGSGGLMDMYRSNRWGVSDYTITGLNIGLYRVTLHFSEIWTTAFTPGVRVFNVEVQGVLTFQNVDIAAAVTGFNAYPMVVPANVQVTNGVLTVGLRAVVQNPVISGIEVEELVCTNVTDAPAPPTSIPTSLPTVEPSNVLTVAPSDQPTSSPTPAGATAAPASPTESPTKAPSAGEVCNYVSFRWVNCGNKINAITTLDGTVWEADPSTGPGGTQTVSPSVSIANAGSLAPMFRSNRWGNSDFLLTGFDNGEYRIKLYFAELWSGAMMAGQRVFDVFVQGQVVSQDLDVAALVGGNAAYSFTTNANITDGTLLIQALEGLIQNPIISGIEVQELVCVPVTAAPAVSSPTVGPTASPTLNPLPVGMTAAPAALTESPTKAPSPGEVCDYASFRWINCGNKISAITLDGNIWEVDGSTGSGSTQTASAFTSIANSGSLAPMFRSNRWGNSDFLLTGFDNDEYRLKLHFTELWSGAMMAGQRVFDVFVQGQLIFQDVDVAAAVGGNAAYTVMTNVNITDGTLLIQPRTGLIQNPIISGIEVQELVCVNATAAPTTEPPTLAPSGPTTSPMSSPPTVCDFFRVRLVNCGNQGSPTVINGDVWESDFSTGGGGIQTVPSSTPIANAMGLDPMYRQNRWGESDFLFTGLNNGMHRVLLHFAELWSGGMSPGARVFNVFVQSQLVFQDLDVAAAVGGNAAYTVMVDVMVTDGTLSVQPRKGLQQNPMISGIEVYEDKCVEVTEAPTVAPTPAATTLAPFPNTASCTAVGVRYINAGQLTNNLVLGGEFWESDNSFTSAGGNSGVSQVSTSVPIVNGGAISQMYRNNRWGQNDYLVGGLTAGSLYRVVLHFAELFSGTLSVGARKFDIYFQDVLTYSEVDVFELSGGGFTALQLTHELLLGSSGSIKIGFRKGSIENPFISGVEVQELVNCGFGP